MELHTHPVVWLAPSYAMILRTLHNPVYAGAYVFGKSETVRRLDAEGSQKVQARRVPRSAWRVLIRDHHPAYISFEQFLADQERLRGNAQMRHRGQADEGGPAREGPAVLQGVVVCGHCGRKMRLSYGGHHRHRVYQYRCSSARQQRGGADCQVLGGKRIDQAVVKVFLEATQPCAAEAARWANEEARRSGCSLFSRMRYSTHRRATSQCRGQRALRPRRPRPRQS